MLMNLFLFGLPLPVYLSMLPFSLSNKFCLQLGKRRRHKYGRLLGPEKKFFRQLN
jgi:hypothetical protein